MAIPAFAGNRQEEVPLFRNPDAAAEKRIDDLIARLTQSEKIDLLRTTTSIPRLGIRGTGHAEGIHGLSMGGPRMARRPGGTKSTIFPQGIGLGATWDPDLVEACAHAEGVEARWSNNSGQSDRPNPLIIMSPNADLARDPRWGRTEECYGEDPLLNGTLVTAFVKGLQGNDPRYWLSASLLKHFLANSNENTRSSSSSDFDERLWREYYSVPFRMGIMEGGSRAYMAAYNSYNGIPCGTHPMLKAITVKEWGNDGIICTDGGAVAQMVNDHHYFPDLPHAVAGTIHAGITKYLEQARPAVLAALKQGLIDDSDLDAAIRPNLRVLLKLGLLDPKDRVPYSSISGGEAPWLSAEHRAIALKAAHESIVLLKNSGMLPLSKSLKVAVIGPMANDVLQDWYGGVPSYKISILDGIRAKLGVDVAYAPDDKDGNAEKIARAADVAIVCVGNDPVSGNAKGWGKIDRPSEGREAVDRKIIDLQDEDLVKKIYSVNHRTVMVLMSSFPYAINWHQRNVPAIVQMAHSCQEQGSALADVLFGDFNPAGRLPMTWPVSLDNTPPITNYDLLKGRTYLYDRHKPLYPFGFGLSYAKFHYSNLKLDRQVVPAYGAVTVTLDVTNTSRVGGDEVVQLYVRHLGSKVSRPLKELKAFRRTYVGAGQTKQVTLRLEGPKLAYWSTDGHQWIVEPEKIELALGASSADVRLRTTLRVLPGVLPATSALTASQGH